MAVYDHEEQEQLEELKAWWKQYGNLVTSILLALALAAVAWQGWNWWQRKQSAEAAGLYAAVQRAAVQGDARRTRELAGQLIDQYGRTAYAAMAAMLSGKVQVVADSGGDPKSARAQLQWAAENAADDALRELARLRLAALLLDTKDYDEALRQLATEPATASFAPRFNELRGDVLLAQGKTTEARTAYEAALAKAKSKAGDGAAPGQQRAYLEMLQTKLESVGGGAK